MVSWDIDTVRRLLQEGLAGDTRTEIARDGYAHAAVLLPLVYRQHEPDVLLTRRTDHVETHKGQISFPGGVIDHRDRDRRETALRETEEELGISPSLVETLGLLDDLQTPTGFIITPVVGLIASLPALAPNPGEVAEVLFVPLRFFADKNAGRREYRTVQGTPREVWFFEYGDHTIWGATAAILRSFVQRFGLMSAGQTG